MMVRFRKPEYSFSLFTFQAWLTAAVLLFWQCGCQELNNLAVTAPLFYLFDTEKCKKGADNDGPLLLIHHSRVANKHSVSLAISTFGNTTPILTWLQRRDVFFHAVARELGVVSKHSLHEMNSLECNDS